MTHLVVAVVISTTSQIAFSHIIFIVFFGPLLSFIVVIIPEIGAYVGDSITCIYLLPQVLLKYQEKHERHKHLTLYEIGNWICITLWVVLSILS